jgi:ammonia channel protein AmtB
MQDSIAPLTHSGIFAASSPIRSCMIVAVQASGRIVMSIGPFGLEPADQLVVVDDRLDVRGVHIGGQFGGVVGVDDHQAWPASMPR